MRDDGAVTGIGVDDQDAGQFGSLPRSRLGLALSDCTPLSGFWTELKLSRSRKQVALLDSELGRVAATGPVDEMARYFQCCQDPAYALHVVADLLREEAGLGSGLAEDLVHGDVARG